MKTRFLLAVAGFAALSGCSDAEPVKKGDSTKEETWMPVLTDDVWFAVELSEQAPEILSELEPERPAFPEECDTGNDCRSGLCVRTEKGKVCAVECLDGCPEGFECAEVTSAGPDLLHLCLPDFVPICRPCRSDEDCVRYPGDHVVACREFFPGEGSFCTMLCDESAACPEGFTCTAGICTPSAGECDCLSSSTNIGFSTTCWLENAHGRCYGQRTCLAEGLEPCDASVPEVDVCNGVDDDCDGETDEEHESIPCSIVNQHGSCPGVIVCNSGVEECSGPEAAPEKCNGKDDDCDGAADENDAIGCMMFHLDSDGDGFGSPSVAVCACQQPAGYVESASDCNDQDPSIHPAGLETCDGKDENCNGQVDEGCDEDGDGFCNKTPVVYGPSFRCKSAAVDCNDASPVVYPGAQELCDGLDNNCDLQVDDGCDVDGDGYCHSQAIAWGEGYVCKSPYLDCNDTDPEIHPAANELCNAVDDDCDGEQDEECDLDKDGFCAGPQPNKIKGCLKSTPLAIQVCLLKFFKEVCAGGFGDCNDFDPAISPSAPEICDSIDNNCNGQVDEGLDVDHDSFCSFDPASGQKCDACKLGGGDCNDFDPNVHPFATDLPDEAALDSNCDGIDGSLESCVFVSSSSGQDTNPGTAEKPKKTIAAGISKASLSVTDKCVIVAIGTYVESKLVVDKPMAIWGGYDPNAGWSVVPGAKSKIHGKVKALMIEGVQAPVSIGRFEIHSADAVKPGESSVGILARNSTSVQLADLEVFSGKGAQGSSGKNGSKGIDGPSGKPGGAWCYPNPFCHGGGPSSCSGKEFGAGAKGYGPMTCGGDGQWSGVYILPDDWNPEIAKKYPTGLMEAGQPSCCYKQLGPIAGGFGGAQGKEPAGDGGDGQDGVNGADGAAGKGGNGKAILDPDGLVGTPGSDGAKGGDGCGGGGGGFGDNYDSFWECEQKGGQGGGGGAGGTGGEGGKGGKGGGASVAVLLYKSGGKISSSILHTSQGGKGGTGGAGGAGGLGGAGGKGGAGNKAGAGGNGGKGGNGGHGGGGGGGSGGPSVGIVYHCSYPVFISPSAVKYDIGPGGQGGEPGKSGLKAPSTSKGKPGYSAATMCF